MKQVAALLEDMNRNVSRSIKRAKRQKGLDVVTRYPWDYSTVVYTMKALVITVLLILYKQDIEEIDVIG